MKVAHNSKHIHFSNYLFRISKRSKNKKNKNGKDKLREGARRVFSRLCQVKAC